MRLPKNKTGIELTCNNKTKRFGGAICGYIWLYDGGKKLYACCPQCKGAVKIPGEE